LPFTSVLLMKLYERQVMHASIWIPVPTYARYKIEVRPQRKTHGSARTKEEDGGRGGRAAGGQGGLSVIILL
jgi:hypothetical protein